MSTASSPLNRGNLAPAPDAEFSVALLPWGDCIEDFLDTIGLSFEEFQTQMSGGWLFGSIEALQGAGVRPVLVCFSIGAQAPKRFTHTPTGAALWVLPPTRLFRSLRKWSAALQNPQKRWPPRKVRRAVLPVVQWALPRLSTPSRALSWLLKREKCAAIICQEYEYARFDACVWLGKRSGVPVLATFQGGIAPSKFLERALRRLTIRSGAGLVIAPRGEIERVRAQYALSSAKVARIFNPISLAMWSVANPQEERELGRSELNIPLDARVVICHGRIEIHRKGLDVLLEAWQLVTQARPQMPLHLLLVGTGSDAARLRARIEEMNLRGVVWVDRYVLDRAEMKRYLCAADVSVLPSRHEGFPVAPLEAMACGLPVVAADAPGVSDILEEGQASGGVVVPREDASALADALGQLLDDEKLCLRLSAHARERVQNHFSLEVVGRRWRSFLEERGAKSKG